MSRHKYAGRTYVNTFNDPVSPRGLGNNVLDAYYYTIRYRPASLLMGCTGFMYREQAKQFVQESLDKLGPDVNPKLIEFKRA